MFKVPCDLVKMTVAQLKDELEARGATRSGALKAVLRGRLRAMIITAHSAATAAAAASGRKRARE